MSEKLRVGILGATGMVEVDRDLFSENHPWFEVVTLAASPSSAGMTYVKRLQAEDGMDIWMPEAVKILL